MNNLNYIV